MYPQILGRECERSLRHGRAGFEPVRTELEDYPDRREDWCRFLANGRQVWSGNFPTKQSPSIALKAPL